ncbi:hypothetical protein MGG_17044 [Pyricularia oryzae 70-15]|uniref:Uncharacterized protein n=3 Tax=Pyricularia oryzae TaxID=318829 RepID=G4N659_PYRO7|nr:uncharacterized protein MGG_17044 [Pyricularia oryzae 70-15]EHA49783.1 hypothetical protein MGG_17044 [Pyricularia oryzae 70-15]ELQ40737.1 hypothetical protein OOU_Y34scaffold00370g31 [Pyricularia oryzae Y34]
MWDHLPGGRAGTGAGGLPSGKKGCQPEGQDKSVRYKQWHVYLRHCYLDYYAGQCATFAN